MIAPTTDRQVARTATDRILRIIPAFPPGSEALNRSARMRVEDVVLAAIRDARKAEPCNRS